MKEGTVPLLHDHPSDEHDDDEVPFQLEYLFRYFVPVRVLDCPVHALNCLFWRCITIMEVISFWGVPEWRG